MRGPPLSATIREGMRFGYGAPRTTQEAVAGRTGTVSPSDLLAANQQVGLREMLEDYARSYSPSPRVEHRRKAPTLGIAPHT
jgi:hypothetical protein